MQTKNDNIVKGVPSPQGLHTPDPCKTTVVCESLEGCLEKARDAFHNSSRHEELPKLNYCVKFSRPLACQRPIFRLACPGIESMEKKKKKMDGEGASCSDKPC